VKPWKILKSETVYSCPPYVTVDSHTVELPDGRAISPYFRIHLRSWVVMVAVTPEREVIVNRQYRHGFERVCLMLPGGLLEPGEDAMEAARRELLEETGYVSEHWQSLGSYVPNSNYRCGEAQFFLATDARKIAEPNDGDLEETENVLIPYDELVRLSQTGAVPSMSSVAALLLAGLKLNS